MKLQHLAIVFVIIFLPILLVTSYYIQQQVDTISLQEVYDSKLLDATHDAMYAFELNTANEELSSVADSLRSIIEASNNIFLNTLATNLGVSNASKSFVQPYIPAILYTLYDGYYIYAPTNVPEVCTDKYGQTIDTSSYGVSFVGSYNDNGKMIGIYSFEQGSIEYFENTTTANSGDKVNYDTLPDNIKKEYAQMLYKNKDGTYSTVLHNTGGDKATYYKQSYILKSFVSYSANYSNDDIDITVNYTLDNFITIEGTINDIYYTKSGYLISNDLVKNISVIGIDPDGKSINLNEINDWKSISELRFKELIYSPEICEVKVELKDGTIISNRDGKNGSNYWDDTQSAVEYYVNSWLFSSWVYENLSGIKSSNISNNNYSIIDVEKNSEAEDINYDTKLYDKMMYDFGNDKDIYPFAIGESNDPENPESEFALHKRNVIKNSVTYNLVLAMITYTEMSRTTEFNLPVLSDVEWDKILSNVSIVSFMQGMRCGLKVYNNYAIVSSTNNEISVTPDEIFYVAAPSGVLNTSITDGIEAGNVETAHRLDCTHLEMSDNYISFKSKEIKYDKIYSKVDGKYLYDHHVYTDYNCLVTSNYFVEGFENSSSTEPKSFKGNKGMLNYLLVQLEKAKEHGELNKEDEYTAKLKAYRIAVAKERNNLYKSIEYEENYGYKIYNFGTSPTLPTDGKKLQAGAQGDTSQKSVKISLDNNKTISEVSRIEIVVSGTKNNNLGIFSDKLTVALYENPTQKCAYDSKIIGVQAQDMFNTYEFEKDFDSLAKLKEVEVSLERGSGAYIKSIKVYFK